MASLVPCSVCQRHVRHHESACPFCGAERQPTADLARERGFARDAKRATLVAIGLTLASPACGGKEDEGRDHSNSGYIVPYGLSPPPPGGSGGTDGGGNAGSGGASGSAGGDEGVMPVPPYGAMPPPLPDGGSGGGADTPDSGTLPDAGETDAGDPDAGGSGGSEAADADGAG